MKSFTHVVDKLPLPLCLIWTFQCGPFILGGHQDFPGFWLHSSATSAKESFSFPIVEIPMQGSALTSICASPQVIHCQKWSTLGLSLIAWHGVNPTQTPWTGSDNDMVPRRPSRGTGAEKCSRRGPLQPLSTEECD